MTQNDSMGIAGKIATLFVSSRLTPLLIIGAVFLGIGAACILPREEEPQIKVPMIDIMVSMPGASPEEVEARVTRPMEKLLWEIPGIEYLYSTSSSERSLVIARFYVGEELEKSLLKIQQKLQANFDRIPSGVYKPLIKPRTIDDVPILTLTLHSKRYDGVILRKLAVQIDDEIKKLDNLAETSVIGGYRRQIKIQIDPLRLASRNLGLFEIVEKIKQANKHTLAGSLTYKNNDTLIELGDFIKSTKELKSIVVGVADKMPIYLFEVATITDSNEEVLHHVLYGSKGSPDELAVTISIAKRPGANAIKVAHEVLKKIDSLKGVLVPQDVCIDVTRNYGETAAEKSNELLIHMGIAVIGVALLIWLFLGWRQSLVVLVTIPSTLALTLLVFYLYGYTLNRITLFALIFSIGILVDDAIVVLENIERHLALPISIGKDFLKIIVDAVAEVGNPTILATFAVIAAILPMAFVGGLMGPYMRPIPIGASAAMFFSLIVAFIATPWASSKFLKHSQPTSHEQAHDFFTRIYHRVMEPLLDSKKWRGVFLTSILILLCCSIATVLLGWVKVKMLPFDNKSEFQVMLKMPEGTSLEQTTRALREMGIFLKENTPEMESYQIYSGTSSPFNFNGLVRHYFLRKSPNLGDIQVNLVPKEKRANKSHEIAKRVRKGLALIAKKYNARLTLAEVPPGPPVLQTLVAEIYGPTEKDRLCTAQLVKAVFEKTKGVVDVDTYMESDQKEFHFVIDKEKAALYGISEEKITQSIQVAIQGLSIDLFHSDRDREDVPLFLEIPRQQRAHLEDLLSIKVCSNPIMNKQLISLRDLVKLNEGIADKSIYHKNLKNVIYVTADVAGEIESPVYAIFKMNKELSKNVRLYDLKGPDNECVPAMKWDGEWHITLEVFRDLGLAFAIVLVLIYMLMVGWFHSFLTPLIVMVAIPFSLIGILPGHACMNAFFTATSMIGFMAGAGIVVRNSIILVYFIELRRQEGILLRDAVVEAGSVRFRPMLLTALAVIVGASVILADPIFQGLAISLMAGEVASLLISRMAVPVLYFMAFNKK